MPPHIARLAIRALPATIWASVIWALSSTPGGSPPPWLVELRQRFGALIPADLSFLHVPVYALLALLLAFALQAAPTRPRRYLWAAGISIAYGLLDEYHQSFVPGRDVSVLDLLYDALGTAIGLGVHALFLCWRAKQKALAH